MAELYLKPALIHEILESEWDGKGKTITHSIKKTGDIDGYIILVQQEMGMHILAAGELKLPKTSKAPVNPINPDPR